MIPTLEQAVLVELAAAGPIGAELRALAKDRTRRAESALLRIDDVRVLGSFRAAVAARIARVVREEHAAGVRVRGA